MKSTRGTVTTVIACGLALLFGVTPTSAQEKRDERKADGRNQPLGRRGPGVPNTQGFGFGFVSSEMRSGGKVVKGAPYSADAVTESTQTLADGTKLTRRTTAQVYRDGEGRTRREQSAAPVGPFATSGDAPNVVFIHDPVAKVSYTLLPESRTAFKSFPPPPPPDGSGPLHPGPPPDGDRGPRPRRGPPPDRPPFGPGGEGRPERIPPGERTTESLGKRTVEGVEAEGTRTTVTIPVNAIGNDRPLAIKQERWESPELQTTVESRHSDPRWGETLYRLTNIKRGEPDRTLFSVPADYTVKEGRPGPPRRGGERRRPDED